MAPGALEKRGYRLPTEAEWECACRAGAVTSHYYGESEELLGQYAWYTTTTNDQSVRPGGLLKPNDRGLFDLYGYVFEWVMDPAFIYRWPFAIAKADKLHIEDLRGIKEENNRLLRGGSFVNQASFVRSAFRFTFRPSSDLDGAGLRPARTLP